MWLCGYFSGLVTHRPGGVLNIVGGIGSGQEDFFSKSHESGRVGARDGSGGFFSKFHESGRVGAKRFSNLIRL